MDIFVESNTNNIGFDAFYAIKVVEKWLNVIYKVGISYFLRFVRGTTIFILVLKTSSSKDVIGGQGIFIIRKFARGLCPSKHG